MGFSFSFSIVFVISKRIEFHLSLVLVQIFLANLEYFRKKVPLVWKIFLSQLWVMTRNSSTKLFYLDCILAGKVQLLIPKLSRPNAGTHIHYDKHSIKHDRKNSQFLTPSYCASIWTNTTLCAKNLSRKRGGNAIVRPVPIVLAMRVLIPLKILVNFSNLKVI